MSLRLHGDTLAVPGALDFATCLWPNAAPDWLDKALADGLADRVAYPDDRHAREAIGARHGRCAEEVLLLNGACEAFWLLAHALRPRRAACVHPSFTEPEAALPRHRHRHRSKWPVGLRRLDAGTRSWSPPMSSSIVVGKPQQPDRDADADRRAARRSPGPVATCMLVDESFIDFVPGRRREPRRATATSPDCLVVRSLTKLYALAGIRCRLPARPPEPRAAPGGGAAPAVERQRARRLVACWAGGRSRSPDAERGRRGGRGPRVAELTAAVTAHARVRTWPSAANFLPDKSVRDGPETLTDGLAGAGDRRRARPPRFPGSTTATSGSRSARPPTTSGCVDRAPGGARSNAAAPAPRRRAQRQVRAGGSGWAAARACSPSS